MIFPSENEFLKLAKQGNLIPVYREILGDLDTPVSTYYKILGAPVHRRTGASTKRKKAIGPQDFPFLLESVEGEEKVARYSFLASEPEMVIQCRNGQLEIITFKNGRAVRKNFPVDKNPLNLVRDLMKDYRFVRLPGLPRFCGGMVGYIGYDTARFFEKLPDKPADGLGLPDMVLILAKDLIIFDHRNHKIQVVSCAHIPEKAGPQQRTGAYRQAIRRIEKWVAQIQKPLKMEPTPRSRQSKKTVPMRVRSNVTQPQFERMVEDAKEQIRSGEIIQVVLSQRFHTELKTHPSHIYRTLRGLNPSPYMYYLHLGEIQIVGSSPELLVRCEEGAVETRPIAGTRRRGATDEEDRTLAQDLLNDPKERAEHIMLVDLGRNDLGRVCREGTVKLSEFMAVEKYSHVMHIVSNVQGQLRDDQDAFDVLQAAFPAGTVSGAPKIRAMEIIDGLENVSRGPYAGCIAYFSFSGNLDSCITIRTIVCADGQAYVQAGAGIVADSDPQTEYQETVNKARAQLLALEKAGDLP